MKKFVLDKKTSIKYSGCEVPVIKFVEILKRDITSVCLEKSSECSLILKEEKTMAEEAFLLKIDGETAFLFSGDSLGFIYGLLYISKEFLGVKPFWFWMDQKLPQMSRAVIPDGEYRSESFSVRYRGWFFNDEVLMMGWPYNKPDKKGWEMGFEALLRCGGNMVIPGTDKMSRKNRKLASDYGLWITHHHAEPLGAEMFAHAYPDVEADYFKQKDKFLKLWEDAVTEQKNMKVVWNLCFRGQGDCPFWSSDKSGQYDTDEKRGALISQIIAQQAEIVKKHVDNPVFCTNLYGEIMELYEAGHISFPKNVILVRADNGFGKMVTRRRGNHNPRVNSMPDPKETAAQGIYYHASFYDLQAANHITMTPNSVGFVANELNHVLANGGKDFWVINCSNVKPHVYYLDAISRIWAGEKVTDESQAKHFAQNYFDSDIAVENSYRAFCKITPKFGPNEDEHAGEQFYTENIRYFAHYIMLGRDEPVKELKWLTGDKKLSEQLRIYDDICSENTAEREEYLKNVPEQADVLKLQAYMHYYGCLGVHHFYDGFCALESKEYADSFFEFGQSAECFETVDRLMKEKSTGIWHGYYDNDCLADFKFTAYIVRKLMGYVRELGDNSGHYKWQHEYTYAKEDKGVALILLTSNHMTDEELYQKMKEKMG